MDEQSVTCEDARRIIGELSPRSLATLDEKTFVMIHIRGCVACGALYEKNLALARSLDGWQVPSPQTNIQAQVMASVAQLEKNRGNPSRFLDWLKEWTGYRFQVPAVAAVAVVILLLVSLGFNVAQIRLDEGLDRGTEVAVREDFSPAGTIARQIEDAILQTPLPKTDGGTAVNYPVGGTNLHGFESGAVPPVLIVIMGAPPMGFDPIPFRSAQFQNIQTQSQKENRL